MQGVMLIEALIAILIFSIGILAIVGMQGVAIKTVTQSKYRSEAAFLANEVLSQLWADTTNLASYDFPQGAAVPTRLTAWKARVDARLPGTTDPNMAPTVTITSANAQGATVQIVIWWRLPEEKTQGVDPHSYTVLASVYANPP
jgi:type IV pilus assembly protein PilV